MHHLTRRRFLASAAATAAGVGVCRVPSRAAAIEADARPQRPNILVIFSDELNLNDLACYGGPVPTPHLDRLAAEGARFTKARCVSPACTPSRYSLLTGTYPGRCRHPAFLDSNPVNQPYSVAWDSWITQQTLTPPRNCSR
jgi:hypothetical protein